MGIKEIAEYGSLGLWVAVMIGVFGPMVKAFIGELTASREERNTMRLEHNVFITEHSMEVTKALVRVQEGLDSVCKRLNGGIPK